jgi:hypothetical protein
MTANGSALKGLACAIMFSCSSVFLGTVINDVLHDRRPDISPLWVLVLVLMTAGFMMLERMEKSK